MARRSPPGRRRGLRLAAARSREEGGQALVLLLGVAGAVVLGVLVFGAFGQALGARSGHQRAADLAAVSGARSMREAYPRLFESPYLRPGVPNPRHLSRAEYLELARGAAVRGARANGVPLRTRDVTFPERNSFAPTRVMAVVRGSTDVRLGEGPGNALGAVPIRARATAELSPPATAGAALGPGEGGACPPFATGGGYSGPLACRMGKAMRPDVAEAFDRLAAAARADGLSLSINSAFRSDDEQRRLFAANPNPRWVAPPGTSLHRYATELDLGPPAAYGWLRRNHRKFGFIRRT